MNKSDELYNKMVLLIGLGKTFSSSNFKEDFKYLQNLLRREIEVSHDKNFINEGIKILREADKISKTGTENSPLIAIPIVGDYIKIMENFPGYNGNPDNIKNLNDDIPTSVLFEMIRHTCEYL